MTPKPAAIVSRVELPEPTASLSVVIGELLGLSRDPRCPYPERGVTAVAADAAALLVASATVDRLRWLHSHCHAIGMTRKSDSGKPEDDIALFTVIQKERIDQLERAAASESQGGWRTIESAPKTGCELLLSDGTEVCSARWFERHGEWVMANGGFVSKPTLWQPLPEPSP